MERNLEQGGSLEARITGQAGGSELGAQDVVSGTPRGGAQEDLGRVTGFELLRLEQ